MDFVATCSPLCLRSIVSAALKKSFYILRICIVCYPGWAREHDTMLWEVYECYIVYTGRKEVCNVLLVAQKECFGNAMLHLCNQGCCLCDPSVHR